MYSTPMMRSTSLYSSEESAKLISENNVVNLPMAASSTWYGIRCMKLADMLKQKLLNLDLIDKVAECVE